MQIQSIVSKYVIIALMLAVGYLFYAVLDQAVTIDHKNSAFVEANQQADMLVAFLNAQIKNGQIQINRDSVMGLLKKSNTFEFEKGTNLIVAKGGVTFIFEDNNLAAVER